MFFINVVGEPAERKWSNYVHEENAYKQGNIFKTKQEVYKERDKRELLMRFKQFRDKCNGDWKPDFKDDNVYQYYIALDHIKNLMRVYSCWKMDEFNLFGYFKNETDCKRAIELFGDEIKRLFVEEE